MRKRREQPGSTILIAVIVSLAINLSVFLLIVLLKKAPEFDLVQIIPIDLYRIIVPEPPPPPPPPPEPPPPPPPRQEVVIPEPLQAPIAADPEPVEVATIQTSPVVVDQPPVMPRVVEIDQLDAMPRRIAGDDLSRWYPTLARRAGRTGFVLLKFVITTEGAVENLRVLRERPENMGFGEAAKGLVRTFRYTVPTIGNVPVMVGVELPVRFVLD